MYLWYYIIYCIFRKIHGVNRLADENYNIYLDDYNEAEESKPEYIPLKDHKYVIVSKVAYMIGLREHHFATEGKLFKKEIFDQMKLNKNARIIRNLCMLRTAIERGYQLINNAIKSGRRNVFLMEEYVPQDSLISLANDGVRLSVKDGAYPVQAIVEINKVISDRINNCKGLFPTWLKWEYLRDIFVMPDGMTVQGATAQAKIYYEHLEVYPYKVYVNIPAKPNGNILQNDRKFVSLIYEWNEDSFTDVSKVMDVSEYIKSSIYDFIDRGSKIDIIVDCENSDVYNLISMLRSLEWDGHLDKINQIILVNDVHTNIGWPELEKYTQIPVDHMMTQRIKSDKSVVDGELIARTFEECYENNVDSFVLLSSDSDFWTLIKRLKRARFLVMVEHLKCGPDLKNALEENGIFYCFLDDFYSGEETDKIKKDILMRYLSGQLKDRDFNLREIFTDAIKEMRLDMTEGEKNQFFAQHLKNIRLNVVEDGTVQLRLKER